MGQRPADLAPRRTVLLALAAAPAALLTGSAIAEATGLDGAVVTKAAEVRSRLLAAAEAARRVVALDKAQHEAVPAERGAIADSLHEAEKRDSAALAAASKAVGELSSMPARSLRGIVAKASIFRPPLAFSADDPDHVAVAAALLRDFGCSVDGQPAPVA